jgi:hypothetical protein
LRIKQPCPRSRAQNAGGWLATLTNHLFAGSPRGAETWAILASLINSCKLNEINPQAYLTDVLERVVSGRTTINRLDELLPWTWKAARQDAELKAAA